MDRLSNRPSQMRGGIENKFKKNKNKFIIKIIIILLILFIGIIDVSALDRAKSSGNLSKKGYTDSTGSMFFNIQGGPSGNSLIRLTFSHSSMSYNTFKNSASTWTCTINSSGTTNRHNVRFSNGSQSISITTSKDDAGQYFIFNIPILYDMPAHYQYTGWSRDIYSDISTARFNFDNYGTSTNTASSSGGHNSSTTTRSINIQANSLWCGVRGQGRGGTKYYNGVIGFTIGLPTRTVTQNHYYLNAASQTWNLFNTTTTSVTDANYFTPYNVTAPAGYHPGNNYGYYSSAGSSLGSGTVGVNGFTVCDNNLVHVHYYANAHTVAYDANGGSNAPPSQTKTYGIGMNVSSSIPKREGYTFKYWTTTSYDYTGTNNVVQHFDNNIDRVWISILNPTTIEVIVHANNATAVSAPTWTTYNGQDDLVWHTLGSGSWTRGGESFNFGAQISMSSHNYEIGETITHIYAYNNGSTIGCVNAGARGFIFSPGASYPRDQNGGTQTLYAQWQENPDYTLALDANGGTVSQTSKTVKYGLTYTDLPTPTRTGYEFLGWARDFNGSDFINYGSNYKYTDKISIHLKAYMDNWADYANQDMVMISCTESGGWNIESLNGYLNFAMNKGGAYISATASTKWSDLLPGWHTFDLVHDGTYTYGYVDGVKVATSAANTNAIYYNSGNSVFLGAEAGSSSTSPIGCYFKGKIGSVVIKNSSDLISTDNYQTYTTPTQNVTLYAQWKAIANPPVLKARDMLYYVNELVDEARLKENVTVTDEYDSEINDKVKVTVTDVLNNEVNIDDHLNTSQPAKYFISYSVTNKFNLTSTCDSSIEIIDNRVSVNNYSIRYISKKYLNTLSLASKWYSGNLRNELEESLNKEATDSNALYVIEFDEEDTNNMKSFFETETHDKNLNQKFMERFSYLFTKKP